MNIHLLTKAAKSVQDAISNKGLDCKVVELLESAHTAAMSVK